MQENNLFEYAVIRLVPRVEREEFINIGVILYCPKLKFLKAKITLHPHKVLPLQKNFDCEEVEKNLQAIIKICEADISAGPIAKLDMASRFRWLTATKSTVIQSSKVHPGFTNAPQESLEKLFEALVE